MSGLLPDPAGRTSRAKRGCRLAREHGIPVVTSDSHLRQAVREISAKDRRVA